MKLIGILVVLAGWLIPVIGINVTASDGARFFLAVVGIAVSIFGILGILNKAYLKEAIWKK
jgi:uncharacterized membrane protein